MESNSRIEILLVGTELAGLHAELARTYRVTTATHSEEAFGKALSSDVDVVVSPLHAESISGLQLLVEVHPARPRLPIILISGQTTPDMAIAAAKLGAYELLVAPYNTSQVRDLIQTAVQASKAVGVTALAPGEQEFRSTGLVGMSPTMQELYRQIGLAADTSSTVLIQGATGTGKELVARAIHQHSIRAKQPLLTVNCAAITETLFESELFGHEGGAFTGASRSSKIGRFEQANHGTIFLDEIGELPLEMQVKLLRVLQDSRIQRVGGKREIPLDIHVIAATNRDLEKCIQTGKFREDLYHRLNLFAIRTPPLQDHTEDIVPLVRHFLRTIQADKPLASLSIERDALRFLHRQSWPGNVRQLKNTVIRAAIEARCQTILLRHVQQICAPNRYLSTGEIAARSGPLTDLLEKARAGEVSDLHKIVVERAERSLFARAMDFAKGNQAMVARLVGTTRRTVREKLHQFGISNIRSRTKADDASNITRSSRDTPP